MLTASNLTHSDLAWVSLHGIVPQRHTKSKYSIKDRQRFLTIQDALEQPKREAALPMKVGVVPLWNFLPLTCCYL